jgi:hypothetical protein
VLVLPAVEPPALVLPPLDVEPPVLVLPPLEVEPPVLVLPPLELEPPAVVPLPLEELLPDDVVTHPVVPFARNCDIAADVYEPPSQP